MHNVVSMWVQWQVLPIKYVHECLWYWVIVCPLTQISGCSLFLNSTANKKLLLRFIDWSFSAKSTSPGSLSSERYFLCSKVKEQKQRREKDPVGSWGLEGEWRRVFMKIWDGCLSFDFSSDRKASPEDVVVLRVLLCETSADASTSFICKGLQRPSPQLS